MFRRSVLGLLMIPLLAPWLLGQEYFAYSGQQFPWTTDASFGTSAAGLSPTSGHYNTPITPYPPAYSATLPQSPTPGIYPLPSDSSPYPATPPQYPATSQFAIPQYASTPQPQTVPYSPPYTPAYPAQQPPSQSTPYATVAPQLTAPAVAPPPPIGQEVAAAESDTAEPATHEEAVEESAEEPIVIEPEDPKAWYYAPVYWFDLWEGNIELGMSGSNGNTETLNYLLGLDAKRETEKHILDFDLKYDRKSADSVETAHRLFGEIRWELLFEDSRWTWFFHETTEYDEFKAYDLRLSYDTGLGRCLIKNDSTSLLARSGAGLSHEIGSPNEDFVPEAVFGLEFDHKLNERQKFSASSEYSPDVTDFLDYRLKSKASWEVLLDEATNLSLKVSILDRYDSTPNGKKANDLDYTLTLLWSF